MPKITIKGIDASISKIKKMDSLIWPTVMRVIDKYVTLMVADAKSNVPVDRGVAQDSIGQENRDRSVVFYVASAHGAIQEFGFGARMGTIPAELEEEARKFKGYKSGSFKEFVKEIEGWCERKGIDPASAYIIAASILDNGLRPQPFFYPAYTKYKDMMIDEIGAELRKLLST